MSAMRKTKMVLTITGRVIHKAMSFIVFSFLDVVDFLLCLAYKVADFFIESQWKPCYCTTSSPRNAFTNGAKILVSERGESRIVCLTTSSSTKLELEDISDTLYNRPSVAAEVSEFTVNELRRIKVDQRRSGPNDVVDREMKKGSSNGGGGMRPSTFTVNSTIVEMLQGKINGGGGGRGGHQLHPIPRWSDCDCKFCNSWTSTSNETLYVRAQGPKGRSIDSKAKEDVIFIHGFISSSAFWTETLFPNFSTWTKSNYRLFAIDLLGFGRSPKPTDSLYTVREHLEMIEKSVVEPFKVGSFHIVAHSLGCILALALAVKHPSSVKSLTLLAPPYFPVPKGVQATQHVMRKVAPRRVWPPIAFGASMACWYEHISRTICLLICKNHRLWEFLAKQITRNRVRTFLLEGFFCHTHNAAWHTLHNIIFGTASKLDGYLDAVRDRIRCDVNVFHGRDDELIPVECSYNVKKRVPRAHVKVIEKKDHITIVVGRQKEFARELEEIWRRSSG